MDVSVKARSLRRRLSVGLHHLVLVCLISASPGCRGCQDDWALGPGSSDFSAPLSGGYFVWRTSSHEIKVAPNTWNDSTPIIPAKVVELDHDNTFVIAKQQHLRRRSPNDPNDTYEEPAPGVFSYWILNVKTPQVWGPLTEGEFSRKRTELGVAAAMKLHDVNDYRPKEPANPRR